MIESWKNTDNWVDDELFYYLFFFYIIAFSTLSSKLRDFQELCLSAILFVSMRLFTGLIILGRYWWIENIFWQVTTHMIACRLILQMRALLSSHYIMIKWQRPSN